MTKLTNCFAALLAAATLAGCVNNPKFYEAAKPLKPSAAGEKLNALPPPGGKVAIAVYGFTDQTGQFKPTDGVQTLSRAVTQGATSILVEALHQAGNRSWFTVIERERLDNVLRERSVIRDMRATYLGEKNVNPQALPPLLFAGVLLEGGIIGYDSNTKSGGLGGRFLGVGGKTQYREDTVTIYLRAVSVKTGEVLSSVSVRKSLASLSIGADAFRYVSFKNLLEVEAGVAYNEPDQLALRQAIEEAVYELILDGAAQNLWCIRTDKAGNDRFAREHYAVKQAVSPEKAVLPAGRAKILACVRQVTQQQAPAPSQPAPNGPAQIGTDSPAAIGGAASQTAPENTSAAAPETAAPPK